MVRRGRLATPADTADLGVFRERMVEGRRLVRDGQLSPGAEAIQAAPAAWHDSPLDGLPARRAGGHPAIVAGLTAPR